MKKIIRQTLLASIILLGSCAKRSNDMLTVINEDGSCYREFSTKTSADFLLKNEEKKANPFPVLIDSKWKITWIDQNGKTRTDYPISKATYDSIKSTSTIALPENSEPQQQNGNLAKGELLEDNIPVIIRKDFSSIEKMATEFHYKPGCEFEKIKTKNSLNKKFRWFYTYYTYTETYPSLNIKFEVPIEKYLSKDETSFWFTGRPDLTAGMNGIEKREFTGQMENKYNEWINRNLWDSQFKILLSNYDKLKCKPVTSEQLALLKDSLFKPQNNEPAGVDMRKVLKSYFKTDAFSILWEGKESPMKRFEESLSDKYSFIFSPSFKYKLILPGKIIQSNDAVVNGDTLSWQVSVNRFILNDYRIEAQSRKANIWAFILTGLVIFVAIGSFLIKEKNKSTFI